MTRRWEAFLAWVADLFRFAHALVYWNWRKQRFRLDGCRGQAPCQNESDEAKLGLVRCDVVMQWNQPGRFRPLCPLLVRTPEGWRCSVPAKSVRPFWLRAFAISGGSLVTFWLVVTFIVFAFFRWGNGLEIRWVDIAWPSHWSRVRTAQSDRLFHRAMTALQQGNLNEAFLALTSARQRDPGNYRANLLVGQISMFQGSFLFADEVFAQLRRDTPEQAYRTSVVYHDTLLMLLRYGRLARHSFEMARTDQDRASLWVRSLLFALRGGRLAADFVRDHSASSAHSHPTRASSSRPRPSSPAAGPTVPSNSSARPTAARSIPSTWNCRSPASPNSVKPVPRNCSSTSTAPSSAGSATPAPSSPSTSATATAPPPRPPSASSSPSPPIPSAPNSSPTNSSSSPTRGSTASFTPITAATRSCAARLTDPRSGPPASSAAHPSRPRGGSTTAGSPPARPIRASPPSTSSRATSPPSIPSPASSTS